MGNKPPPCLEKPLEEFDENWFVDGYGIYGDDLIDCLFCTDLNIFSEVPPRLQRRGRAEEYKKMEFEKKLQEFLERTGSQLSDDFQKSWGKAMLKGLVKFDSKNGHVIFQFRENDADWQKGWILWFGSKKQDLKATADDDPRRRFQERNEAVSLLYGEQNNQGQVSDAHLFKNADGFFNLLSPCMMNGQKIDRIWTKSIPKIKINKTAEYKQYAVRKQDKTHKRHKKHERHSV